MKKLAFAATALALVGAGVWYALDAQKKAASVEVTAPAPAVASYWTCPMHPQIHSDHPGECPICHMKLVEVKTKGHETAKSEQPEHRAAVTATTSQLEVAGARKTLVEKMDLTAHLPIAGRFISPTTVAFQVYESDLRHLRPGLPFTGENSLRPEQPLTGTIASVDSIVDPTSRTVRVVGQLTKAPHGIITETTFRGDIALKLKDVIGIPESSVLHTGNGDLVYVFHDTDDGAHLVPTAVTLGMKTESYYEVLEGLKAGQSISSGPNFLIDSEAKIRGAGPEGQSSGHTNH